MRKFLKRLSKAIFNRSEIWIEGELYMIRYRFLPDSWPGVRVHKIIKSDGGRDLHDHPFTFLSFILTGGYSEYQDDGSKTWYKPGSVVFRRAETLHRLELATACDKELTEPCDRRVCMEKPAWTLVFRGPYRREWGFFVNGEWVDNRSYIAVREGDFNK